MISKKIGEISFEDLKSYTNDFSEDNFIGNFQFGKGFRGKIEDFDIIVKVWTENTAPCGCFLVGMDVFVFGVILVGLIAKKAFIVEYYVVESEVSDGATFLDDRASKGYKRRKSKSGDTISLVHLNLLMDMKLQHWRYNG
ncbi:putative leucine-rich repeat receptor-like protein kinase [Corchorus capsularis]|uniref:Putative leucine-rich repeat receptor-like protein kinase n=1 Tax=Corchorus capsularis TaxID=210143 RepID=A0A1R3HAW8_COCAP|nr:putative leucine-rich repeat receptor-like protein kinase [Corchorus capsularis]